VKTRVKANALKSYGKRFSDGMEAYRSEYEAFQTCVKERDKRTIQLVSEGLSDEEAEKIVENGDAKDFIGRAFLTDDVKALSKEFAERRSNIQALEKEVVQIFELFKELGRLVEEQQESLDRIEDNIDRAKDEVLPAEKELEKAEDYQARARRCKIIVGIVVVIIIVIVIIVLATSLKK